MIQRLFKFKQLSLLSLAASVTLSFWGSPSLAGDPFRSSNPHHIGDKTEAAFVAIFRQGNYTQAMAYVTEATQTEANEPLANAIRASLAYADQDLDTMKIYASKTLQTAEQLKAKDPLRGNLYIAVGYFLDGAYLMAQKDYLGAINKAQPALQYLDIAEQVDPKDPELNLIKGYLDLFLSKYLPFSDAQQSIKRFEQLAEPDYLKNRALADVYRESKQYDQALVYINKALKESPDNPELLYLKGLILKLQGEQAKNVDLLKQALVCFQQAMTKEGQLSKIALVPLKHDYSAIQDKIKELESKSGS